MTNSQRAKNYINEREKKETSLSPSVSTRNSERAKEAVNRKRYGFDTIASDEANLRSRLNRIYNGWADADTMASTRADMENMSKRLNAYAQYGNLDATKRNGISTVLDSYNKTLDSWSDLSDLYGSFKNANAYDEAKWASDNKGLTYDEVQRRLKTASDEKEKDYLSRYGVISQYKTLEDYNKELGTIDADENSKLRNFYEGIGLMSPSYREKLENARQKYANANPEDAYSYLDAKNDFADKSQYVPSEDNDFYYAYLNDASMRSENTSLDNTTLNLLDELNEERNAGLKARANYIYQTEGAKAFNEFIQNIKPSVSKQSYEDVTNAVNKFVDENPWASVPVTALADIGAVATLPVVASEALASKLGGNYDPYSGYSGLYNINQDATANIAENIEEALPNANLFGENVPSNLYSIFNSTVQSRLGGLMGGSAYTALMGGGAYASTYKDALERGLTPDQADKTATASGIAESLFEVVSWEVFTNAKSAENIKDIVRNFTVNFLTEGSEEFNTDLANAISDALINGGMSEIAQNRENYIRSGMSEADATKSAGLDFAKQLGMSFIGGGLSGGAIGGFASAVDYSNNINTGKNLDVEKFKTATEGLEINEDISKATEGKMSASKYAKLGNLYKESFGKSYLTNSNAVQTAMTERLTESGVNDSEAAVLSTSVNKLLNGDRLTSQDKKNIKSEEGQKLLTAFMSGDESLLKSMKEKGYNENRIQSIKESYASGMANKIVSEGMNVSEKSDIDIKSIDSVITDGNDITITVDGNEVRASDVSLNQNDAKLVAYASVMPTEAQKSFVDNYSGQNVDAYASAFDLAYGYGYKGRNISLLEGKVSETLNEAQIAKIYRSGMEAKMGLNKSINEETTKLIDSWSKEMKAGSFTTEGIEYKKLDSTKKKLYNFAKVWSSLGINVKIVDDASNDSDNGWFIKSSNDGTGEVMINLSARLSYASGSAALLSDPSFVISTTAHELTHYMEAYAQDLYDDIKMALINFYDGQKDGRWDNLVNRQMKQHGLSLEEAESEVVARACEDMLNNSDTMNQIVANLTKDSANKLKEAIKKILDKVIEFIDKLMKNYGSGSEEARILKQSKDAYEEVRKKWIDGITKAIKYNQALRENIVNGIINNDPSVSEAAFNNDTMTEKEIESAMDEVKHSLKLNDSLMDDAIELNNQNKKAKDKVQYVSDDILAAAASVRRLTANALKNLERFLPEDIEGEAIVDNSSYSKSAEHALVCVRSLVLNWYVDEISEAVGRPLTELEQVAVSQILADYVGNDRECNYCYVAADRRLYRASFLKYYDMYDDVIKKVDKAKSKYQKEYDYIQSNYDEIYSKLENKETRKDYIEANKKKLSGFYEFLNGRSASAVMFDRYIHFVSEGLNGKRTVSLSDFTTDAKMDELLNYESDKSWFVKDAIAYGKGAAQPKLKAREQTINGEKVKLPYVAYNGSILHMTQEVVDKLNEEYGLRIYSYSDYVPAFLLEDMQIVTDAAVKGLKMLAYTKDTGFVKVFAPTGMGINVSVFGAIADRVKYEADLGRINALRQKFIETRSEADKNAFINALEEHLVNDEMQGAIWNDVKELREKFPNVGAVYVATDDNIIEWALAQDWIDVVIPYHLVRGGDDTAKFFGYSNYKSVQGDKKDENWEKGQKTSITPIFHKNNLETYLEELKKNNLKPRFNDWIKNPNYMKLVNETRMAYTELKSVQPIFGNMMEAFEDENFDMFYDNVPIRNELSRIENEGTYGFAKGINSLSEQREVFANALTEGIKAIQKSAKVGNVEKEAMSHFGTTNDFGVAGYLLTDGTMLDFSGAHWLEGYSDEYVKDWRKKNDIRQVDHEDIFEVYDALGMNTSGDNRKKFMDRGNIRLSPEAIGVNISAKAIPTDEQYDKLRDFIRWADGKGTFYVDLETSKPNKVVYEGKLNADKIVNDIKSYFNTGNVPEQSVVAQFHSLYSKKDSLGNNLTDAQIEYFKDSKVVDDEGRLKVMHHGTPGKEFTVFNAMHSDDRTSLFFTDDKEVADSYKTMGFNSSDNGKIFSVYLNITNPYIIDAKGSYWSKIPFGDFIKTNTNRAYFGDYIFVNENDKKNFLNKYPLDILESKVAEANKNGSVVYEDEEYDEYEMSDIYDEVKEDADREYLRYHRNVSQPITLREYFEDYNDYGWYGFNSVLHEYDSNAASLGEILEHGSSIEEEVDNFKKYIKEEMSEDEYEDILDMRVNVVPMDGVEFEKGEYKTTRAISKFAKSNGFDGVIVKNVSDTHDGSYKLSDIAIVYDSNQIKSIDNINPTDNDDIRYSQKISGKDTSRKQTASTFTTFGFNATDRVLDWGGGKYDLAKTAMEETYPGITFEVVDKYNRTPSHNNRIYNMFKNNKADVLTINNVLNVIDDMDEINNVISESKQYLKDDGIAYISIYEGDKSGRHIQTTKEGFQNNEPTRYYLPIVKKYYKNAEIKQGIIVASDSDLNIRKISKESKDTLDAINKRLKASPMESMENSLYSKKVESDPMLEVSDDIEKIKAENELLKDDVARLRAWIALMDKKTLGKVYNPDELNSVADYILSKAKSKYNRATLRTELSNAFLNIEDRLGQNFPNQTLEDWEYIMYECQKVAQNVLSESTIKEYAFKSDSEYSDMANDILKDSKYVEMVRILATDIYNQMWKVSKLVTMADKAQKEAQDSLKAHNEAMDRIIKYTEANEKAKYEEIINNLKDKNKKELEEIKEARKNVEAKVMESIQHTAAMNKVVNKAMQMTKRLNENSTKRPVPDAIKKPMIDLLNAINFSSAQLNKMYGTKYKVNVRGEKEVREGRISLGEALGKLSGLISKNKAENLEDAFKLLDIPEEYKDQVDEIYRSVASIERATQGRFELSSMTTEDLNSLFDLMTAMNKAVENLNKVISEKNVHGIDYYGNLTLNESDKVGKKIIGESHDITKALSNFLEWGQATPYYAFKRMGEGAQYIFSLLQNGQDNYANLLDEITNFTEKTFTEKEVKKWKSEVRTVIFTDNIGEEHHVRMTTAQLMSLYCLSQRKQAMGHMLRGGIRIGAFKDKAKVVDQVDTVNFSDLSLGEILADFKKDRRAIEVANALQKFMSTTCSDWGNEITMKRFGLESFNEEYYFPITSDTNKLGASATDKKTSIYALLNRSFTKPLTDEANNQIMVFDIFDVFAEHSSEMALYNSFALPVLDTIRWWNFQRLDDVDGTGFVADSVMTSLEKAYGKGANTYIRNLLDSISGNNKGGSSLERFAGKMMRPYKSAAVGASVLTMMLQPISYLRCRYMMSPSYLMKALKRKPSIQKCKENLPMAKWKDLGFFETDVSKGLAKIITHDDTIFDKITDWSLKGAGAADSLTWGFIWNACEEETKDKKPKLTPGSKEFNEAVANRMREIVYGTQVVDSVLTRSENMRDSSWYAKLLTAFMSEPTISYNVLMDAYSQTELEARRTQSWKEALKNNKKNIGRAMYSYVICVAAEAVLRGMATKIRRQDDDEDTIADLVLDSFKEQINPLALIPYVKDIVSIFQGYSPSRMDIDAVQQLKYFITSTTKVMQNEKDFDYKYLKQLIKVVSQFTGLPGSNVLREIEVLYNVTFGLSETLK